MLVVLWPTIAVLQELSWLTNKGLNLKTNYTFLAIDVFNYLNAVS